MHNDSERRNHVVSICELYLVENGSDLRPVQEKTSHCFILEPGIATISHVAVPHAANDVESQPRP